jgi:hypothetical protein
MKSSNFMAIGFALVFVGCFISEYLNYFLGVGMGLVALSFFWEDKK